MMAKRSEEGKLPGLGWIDAEVRIFEGGVRSAEGGEGRVSLPHMGWNDVFPQRSDLLFRGMEKDARFYFLHSYYFVATRADDVLAATGYNGWQFASAVRSGNVFGVQFHPEKSHGWGIQLLKNFAVL